VKDDGEPCGAYAMGGSAYCFAHNPDPEVAKSRKAARQKAGKVTSQRRVLDAREARQQRARILDVPPEPTDYVSASAYLSWIVDQVAHGRLDETTGRVLIQGTKEFMRSLDKRGAQEAFEKAQKTFRRQTAQLRETYLELVDEIERTGRLTDRARDLADAARRALAEMEDDV